MEYYIGLSEKMNILVRETITRKSTTYPIGRSFAVMGYVLLNGEFREVIRIDNKPHKGILGTHIHKYNYRGNKKTEYVKYDPNVKNNENAIDVVTDYLTSKYGMFL